MKNDFTDAIAAFLVQQLNVTRNQAQKAFDQYAKDIDKATQDVANAKAAFDSDAKKELDRVNAQIASKKSACDAVIDIAKPFTGACYELGGLYTYRDAILKPGSAVVSGSIKAAEDVTAELKRLQDLRVVADGLLVFLQQTIVAIEKATNIVQLRETSGHTSAVLLSQGVMPTIDLLVVEVNPLILPSKTYTVRNMAIDFREPLKAAQKIANDIFENFKRVTMNEAQKAMVAIDSLSVDQITMSIVRDQFLKKGKK